jgi:hypothetical protein
METASHEYSLLREALGLAGLFTFEVIGPGFRRLNPNSPDWPHAHDDTAANTFTGQRPLQMGGLAEDDPRIEVTSDVGKMPHAIHALAQTAAGIGLSAARGEELIAEVNAICTQGRSAWLGTAWSGPTPLALQIWGVRDGHAQIYRHLCAASAAEVGHLLTARVLAQAMAHDKVSMVDDFSGGDAFDEAWRCERHERWALVAYDARTAWGFLRLTREIARRIAGGALRRGRHGPSADLESVSSPRADLTADSTTR